MTYVKFEVPKELMDMALESLEEAKNSGRIRKGVNEVTKAVERGNAKLVVVGSDVAPPEIVMHLPMLCEEKKIPFIFAAKEEIGASSGLNVPCASSCIVEIGKGDKNFETVISRIKEIKK